MTTAPSPQTTRLPVWKRLAYSAIFVAILLCIPELTLRWTHVDQLLFPTLFKDQYDENSDGMWRLLTSDPVLYWRGRPFARLSGTDEFLNERGFRGNNFHDEKPPRMQRIVCMGDSSTFGMVHHGGINFTYSPTYSTELQRILNKDKKRQAIEVINAGVIGYSTLQGLRLLKHDVRYWHPDLITIRYGVNDHLRIDPNYVAAPEPRNAIARWLQDELLDTRIFQLLIRLRAAVMRVAASSATKTPAANPAAQPAPVQVRVPLSEYEDNLRRFVLEARATGAKVLLMTAPVAPASQEITSNKAKLWVMGYQRYEDLVARHRQYDDVARRVAADMHVPLLDSSRQLQERGLEKYFTKFDFAHPTGNGHTTIAQDLAALIQSENLLAQ